jgi:hypothetical protein
VAVGGGVWIDEVEGDEDRMLEGAVVADGVTSGVGGPEDDGEGGWTIHMLPSCQCFSSSREVCMTLPM